MAATSTQLFRLAAELDRLSMEFDSPDELKQYLRDHPNADKSNHSVKKDKGQGQGASERKKVVDQELSNWSLQNVGSMFDDQESQDEAESLMRNVRKIIKEKGLNSTPKDPSYKKELEAHFQSAVAITKMDPSVKREMTELILTSIRKR